MTFNEFLNAGWSQHGDNPEATVASLEDGLALCTSPGDVSSLVQLTTHLYTEHVQRFVEGERKLREFAKLGFVKGSPAEFAIQRAIMTLRLCEDATDLENDRMGLTPSDLSRSYVQASAALARRDSVRSEKYLKQALTLADSVEMTVDLAKALAVAGNNSASRLEELSDPTDQQTGLMILFAETARKYWEIATKETEGGWLNIERAEYRLAKSLLKARDFARARTHAQNCLDIAKLNQAPALEIFFAYEALALISKAENAGSFESLKNQAREEFEKITSDDQSWAQSSLDALSTSSMTN